MRAVYASLIVNVEAPGLRQPFTYRVPETWPEGVAVGDCVVVPFGRQEAIGYVIGLETELPDGLAPDAVKEIAAKVSGDGASLPPAVLDTARWMARTYLCDLAQAVRTVLPDAQTAHVVRRYALADGWEAHEGEVTAKTHKQVVEALQSAPDGLTENELTLALDGAKAQSPIQLLRKRGVLKDIWRVEAPRAAAREVKAARLLVTWDEAEEAAKAREAKAGAQARLLRTLAEAGGGPLAVALLCEQSQTSPGTLKKLEADALIVVETITVRRRPFNLKSSAVMPPELTGEQAAAVEDIKRRLDSKETNTALLYGVTASGKTEVYLRAIAETRRRGRASLVLVPEIALTAQVVDSFRARIGDRVAVLHSGLSEGERRDEWQRAARGEADVVVGARSGIFAPLNNVGLIVVDEEHESSYKQDNGAPRYHARDVAIARARATGATVILGSATPSVESFYRAETGVYGFLPLRQRALARPLPSVDIIDLREEWKKGSPGVFSPQLTDAITDRLGKGEQIILFLNRRGFAMFLLCRDCGFSTRCPHCDVSLTYHARAALLVCHHCGFERTAPKTCPQCHGERIRPFGIGTEKVEEEVARLFPEARVIRMDRDTTTHKNAHTTMLRTFREGKADILIGTQMVAKGLDFPGVTLVGIISADTALNMPDFRASERAFQLLTQVGGRAGRGRKAGHVLLQTFNPEHESIAAAAQHDYETFYRREIVNRRELSYPPFTRLANVVSQDEVPQEAENRVRVLAEHLGGRSALFDLGPKIGGDDDLQVLGPAPCPLGRLRNRYRWHLLLKAADTETLRKRLRQAFHKMSATERSGISVDIEPLSLM